MKDNASTRLMPVCDGARLLACSERTVWSLIKEGRLPVVRFGKITRIDRQDVEAFIQQAKGAGR